MSKPDLAIKVHRLYKSFDLPEDRIRSVKQWFVRLGRIGSKRRQHVLKGVEFEVQKGEFLGIVGRNGSGKSTLLKLLAGVYTPDKGAIEVHGGLTPFIELGVGFNPELSGRDNVYLNAALLGYSRKETDKMYDDIVRFSELEQHMEKKLKNYSSGMQVRLAFSIAIKARNDILIFDEVLAVGDTNFQRKCFRYFSQLKQDKHTVIFVSHSMDQVQDYCTRVIVVDGGKIIFDGDPVKAIQKYNALNDETEEQKLAQQKEGLAFMSGSGEARIKDVRLNKKTYRHGDAMELAVNYEVSAGIGPLYYGVSVYKSDRSQSIYAISGMASLQKKQLTFTVKDLALAPGQYFVSVGLTGKPDDWRTHYDLHEKRYSFEVLPVNTDSYTNLGPILMETEVQNEG